MMRGSLLESVSDAPKRSKCIYTPSHAQDENPARRPISTRESEAFPMIVKKTLNLSLKSLKDFAKKQLPDQTLIEWDEKDECPLDVIKGMCGPDQLGIQ